MLTPAGSSRFAADVRRSFNSKHNGSGTAVQAKPQLRRRRANAIGEVGSNWRPTESNNKNCELQQFMTGIQLGLCLRQSSLSRCWL